jgi:Flp pilus assembly protein TadD
MNTNQFWNAENIKAVAGLWPLGLIGFLTLVLVVILIFFLPQTRNFFTNLQNFRPKMWKTEFALNQPSMAPSKPDPVTYVQEPATSAPQPEKAKDAPSNVNDQPELDLDPEAEMYYHLDSGRLEDAEQIFQKLQSTSNDPEKRIQREARYLEERFEKGDLAAQNRLRELETRLKEVKTTSLGFVQRMDALCYVFSRDHTKAVQRFKDSADSCVTEKGRATSLGFAAKSLYKISKKEESFQLLKEAITRIQDPEAKASLLTDLADLYEYEKDNFNRFLALQRALSFQPNSKHLLFKTAYACADAEFNELAVLHYEKLVQIDSSHPSASNNLGVAFDKLQISSLAMRHFKLAFDVGDTLAAANFAQSLINAGALDEAEKILAEAKAEKHVHPNVMSSLVRLETVKSEAEEAHRKSIDLAIAEYQYLLGFSDAMLATSPSQFDLDGKWRNSDAEVISSKIESATGSVELIWVESKIDKLRFLGKVSGLASRGKIEKWREPYLGISSLLGGKAEGEYVSYGDGYIFLSKNLDTITIFVQEADSKNHRSISFHCESK